MRRKLDGLGFIGEGMPSIVCGLVRLSEVDLGFCDEITKHKDQVSIQRAPQMMNLQYRGRRLGVLHGAMGLEPVAQIHFFED